MNITLLKYPTDEDWAFAKQCALVTIGKEMKTAPDMEWKHSILRAQHRSHPCDTGNAHVRL